MGKKFKTFIKKIYSIFEGLIEVVYPRESYCIICNESEWNGICIKCKNSINKVKNENIISENNVLIESYGYYGGVLKELILKFKYYNDFTAGDILAEFLEEYILENYNYKEYFITYIPMSRKSKRKRGFNQCEYLAKRISRDLNIDIRQTLVKDRDNQEQKKLKRNERYGNVKNIFKLKNNINIQQAKIILIDDVTTSGATMEEACRILKKFGAKQIKLLTLAKSHI